MSFNEFLEGYTVCLFWTALDIDDKGFDIDPHVCSLEDLREDIQQEIKRDCRAFWDDHEVLIEDNPEGAGHDFCLTRNGHGAGFWDGDWEEPGASVLTSASKAAGSQYLMVSGSQDEPEFELGS